MSKDPLTAPHFDPDVPSASEDLDTLVAGFSKLRDILTNAPFGERSAPEDFPADAAYTPAEIATHVRDRVGTAYLPAGTCAMGGPVLADLWVQGVDGLWVADASVMPKITSANTNAPSMMIGHRAAKLMAENLNV